MKKHSEPHCDGLGNRLSLDDIVLSYEDTHGYVPLKVIGFSATQVWVKSDRTLGRHGIRSAGEEFLRRPERLLLAIPWDARAVDLSKVQHNF